MTDTRFDLICMGRSTLDLFGDETGVLFDDLKGFRAYVGGCPTNICVAARRMGLRTALVTGVGDDYVSGFLLKFLRAEGIDTSHVLRKPGYQTNTVLVALQPPDEMQFVAYHAQNADLELTIADMQAVPLDDCRAFLFTGMNFIKDPSLRATQYAAERAHQHRAAVFMDLDYRTPMWPEPRSYGIATRLTLPLVDVAMGGEEEALAAAGVDSLSEAVAVLRGLVNEAFILKRGAAGSTVYPVDGDPLDIPPFPVEVVNFLGAGDAFAGGFIYGYLAGWSLEKAARFGNACGAMIVRQHGTANALPSLDETLAFLDGRGGL